MNQPVFSEGVPDTLRKVWIGRVFRESRPAIARLLLPALIAFLVSITSARALRALAAVLFWLLCGTISSEATPSSYVVRWDSGEFPLASVEAELDISNGELHMFPGLAWVFDDSRGWATNVRDLRVETLAGASLAVAAGPDPDWRIGDDYSGRVRVSYDVDFSFASRRYSTGNEQVAWREEGALFTTGFALFIYASMESPAVVTIDVPEAWAIATAWPAETSRTYRVKDTNHLIRNILTVGPDYHLERLTGSGVTVNIALLGPHAAAADLVRKTLSDLLDHYVDMFEADSGHFMFALLPGPNDGEGYLSSFASSQPDAPDPESMLVWANSIAHELFHHWNGSRISSEWEHYPERQWFSEGFTEYYANRALLHVGIIDDARYDEILGHYLSFHLFFAESGLFDQVTMRDAGRKKGLYRPGVYDSGVAAAFCLDGLIRESTSGRRSLDDMMRLLDTRFGETGRPIVFNDLVVAASETAESDLTGFFTRYVEGREALPVRECSDRMGYQAIVDGYHVYLESHRGRADDPIAEQDGSGR